MLNSVKALILKLVLTSEASCSTSKNLIAPKNCDTSQSRLGAIVPAAIADKVFDAILLFSVASGTIGSELFVSISRSNSLALIEPVGLFNLKVSRN